MQIDFSDTKPKKLPIASKTYALDVDHTFEPWVVNNQNFEKPEWWHKVTSQLKALYYNHGPKILETVKVEDYLIHP